MFRHGRERAAVRGVMLRTLRELSWAANTHMASVLRYVMARSSIIACTNRKHP